MYWEESSHLTNIFRRVWNHQPVMDIYGKWWKYIEQLWRFTIWDGTLRGNITSGKLLHTYGESPFYSWLNPLWISTNGSKLSNMIYQRVNPIKSHETTIFLWFFLWFSHLSWWFFLWSHLVPRPEGHVLPLLVARACELLPQLDAEVKPWNVRLMMV